MLKKQAVRVWSGFNWLRPGSSEYDYEPLGSIKGINF
jgi:hypothetical protein